MNRIPLILLMAGFASAQECWEPFTPKEYATGAKVSRMNRNYQANWTNKETPGAENWGGWADKGPCISNTGYNPSACWTAFIGGMYKTGSEVSLLGKNYRANWTTSETPGVTNWGGWSMINECTDCSNGTPGSFALTDSSIVEGAGDNAIVGYFTTSTAGVVIYRFIPGAGDTDNNLFDIQGTILRAKKSLRVSDKKTRSIRVESLFPNGKVTVQTFAITIDPETGSDIPTQITETPSMLSQFALYSHDDMNIMAGASITGMIGSNSGIALADVLSAGWQSKITGDIWVSNSVKTLSEAAITGNIYAPRGAELGWAAIHTGSVIDSVTPPYFTLPEKTIPVSGMNAIGAWQEKVQLAPGTFGDIAIQDGGSLVLTAGVYNCKSLSLNSNSIKIYLNIQPGETVELNVAEKLKLGSETEIVYMNNYAPSSLKIHTNQFSELEIPNSSKIGANIVAPNTNVRINDGAVIYGSIYAKKIDVGSNVTVVRPPYLTDIWHSEWAYAPAFDMNQMNYMGVVPNDAGNLETKYAVLYPNLSVRVDKSYVANTQKYLYTVTDQTTQLTSYYTLDLVPNYKSVIYVNDDAAGPIHNGTSWANAYKSLQEAIDDATVSGKEIWLAEGKYAPTKQTNYVDPRSKTFLLPQGVEILGGYKGGEEKRDPQGSPYNTTLTGDVLQNDGTALPAYPFDSIGLQKIGDNAYHVVTITGINRAQSTRLEGVTIEHGVATGVGDDMYGGGIYSKYAYPNIDACVIQHNIARSHGGGMYAGGGIKSFSFALFKNNQTISGLGGGMYLNNSDSISLSRVVFEDNRAIGENSKSFGGGAFVKGGKLSIENAIFTGNNSKGNGGMLYALGTTVYISNVTSTGNSTSSSFGGLFVEKAKATIVNSILWDNGGEVGGDSIDITYTCVSGGYGGSGNINIAPGFTGFGAGDDGKWGTDDDGLKLSGTSPCINSSSTAYPEFDMVYLARQTKDGRDEMGAYTFIPPLTPSNSGSELGYLKENGEFIPAETYYTFKPFTNEWDLALAFSSNRLYHVRFLLENLSYTGGISGGPATFTGYDSNNKVVFSQRLTIQRAPDNSYVNGRMVYYSSNLIMLVNDSSVIAEYQSKYGHLGILFIYADTTIDHFSTNVHTNDYR